jgi:hypothetical protein
MKAPMNPRMPEASGSPAGPVVIDAGAAAQPGRPRWLVAAVLAIGAVVVGGAVAVLAISGSEPPVDGASDAPTASSAATLNASVADQLAYLVEEEKLAHDIYVLSESLYGARVFSNIARSETQHQESIRGLLAARGLSDPTEGQDPGVFTDPTLQALYDSLARRVNVSAAEAFEVGILIEQTDIADLGDALQADPPADVSTVLNRLETASQKHLQAFVRNASRA